MPTSTLGQIASVLSGSTPKTSVAEYWGGTIPWVTPADLSKLDGHYIGDTPRKITDAGLANSGARILPAGSILLSSRAPIGHTAITTVPMATNQGFKSLVPDNKLVDPKYLFWWLRSNTRYLQSLGNGATFKEISKATVERVEIPLPPLPEQRRIAAILDQADELRTKRLRALALLDELPVAMFSDLTESRLVGLERVPLGELGRWQSGGTPSRSRPEFFGGGHLWATSGELGSLYLQSTKEHISDEALRVSSARRVPAGALMLGMYDTAALKSSIAATDMTCNQAVAFGVLGPKVLPEFAYFAVQAQRPEILLLQRGARQKNLNLAIIRAIAVQIPSIEDQSQFAEEVRLVQQAADYMRWELKQLDSLFASLQRRAFRGEL